MLTNQSPPPKPPVGKRGRNRISRAQISEAIKAAAAAGYREVEVRPDGSVKLLGGAPEAGCQDWPATDGAA